MEIADRYQRALISLHGLAIGDAFGSLFTWYDEAELPEQIRERSTPDEPWEYSDDTLMAFSIVETLRDHWYTLCALGDIDTNCAIVGGIVAGYTGMVGIPAEWLQECEPFPEWL